MHCYFLATCLCFPCWLFEDWFCCSTSCHASPLFTSGIICRLNPRVMYLGTKRVFGHRQEGMSLADHSGCDISIAHWTMDFFLVENVVSPFHIVFHHSHTQSQVQIWRKTVQLVICHFPVFFRNRGYWFNVGTTQSSIQSCLSLLPVLAARTV